MINDISERVSDFVQSVTERKSVTECLSVFHDGVISPDEFDALMNLAQNQPPEIMMRIYRIMSFAVSPEVKDEFLIKSILCIREIIFKGTVEDLVSEDLKIVKDKVEISLPLRVNWCGTWTDTPPYCTEEGGAVVNAAVKIDGKYPVKVTLEKLNEKKIVFESVDSGLKREFTEILPLYYFGDPLDPYSLHKAALLSTGILPQNINISLDELCDKLGGGLKLSTDVLDIPKGSGLGTSSILLTACIKALSEFTGKSFDDGSIFRRVLYAEQVMFTGGGWQDQVGGMIDGIKLVTSEKGERQNISYEILTPPKSFVDELTERFCLIYTGKRRYGRTVLREIMGKYLENDSVAVNTLSEIRKAAYSMKKAINSGDFNKFIRLMNRQLALTKCIDSGYSDGWIEKIFSSCEDLISGKMICGAGGGGFLQVILKRNVTKEDLKKRLDKIYAGTDVALKECEFIF